MQTLPDFKQLNISNAIDVLSKYLNNNKALINRLVEQENSSWESLIIPLEKMDNELDIFWSPIQHLHSVMNSDELREVYNQGIALLSDYGTEIGQNEKLYQAYQKIKDSNEFSQLDDAQQKVINNALRSFRLSGVHLGKDKKQQYKELQKQLSELTTKFEQHLLDETNEWVKQFDDESALKGLPELSIAMAKQLAEQRELSGYAVTLDFPSYYAVMSYAEDRSLREAVYRAYTTRASEYSEHKERDNSVLMEQILFCRAKAAELLGFANHAEKSCQTKMADSPLEIEDFLLDLAHRSKPFAEKELEELKRFAQEELKLGELNAWDMMYASEKYQNKYFDLSQEDLKPYFPIESVINGLFNITEQLFDVTFKQNKSIETWHDDILFYEVLNSEKQMIAGFYLDLYARQNKRGGAWMDVCMSRLKTDIELQLPIAFLTCNAAPPIGDKPAQFTHDEVITLFHEFGHGIHHMLTKVDYSDVSGISGVEWDAVELPSQFMENWCWTREGIDKIAAQVNTGEPMPEKLFNKMLRTRHFQAGMMMLRQLEFSLFDMRIHQMNPAPDSKQIAEILQKVRDEISVVQPPAFNRFQNSFSHIFAGGYAAGYYSYKWAEVLSADAFARFEEEGLFNPQVGKDYLEQILSKGGSRSAMDNFIAFRGRKPKPDALLRHSGLDGDVRVA